MKWPTAARCAPTSLPVSAARRSRFTSRAAPLWRPSWTAMAESYRRTVGGSPQVISLVGEAGMGRTRLATEFLAWASAAGAEVLQGSAFESGSLTPFLPLVEVIRSLFDRGSVPTGFLGEARLAPLEG